MITVSVLLFTAITSGIWLMISTQHGARRSGLSQVVATVLLCAGGMITITIRMVQPQTVSAHVAVVGVLTMVGGAAFLLAAFSTSWVGTLLDQLLVALISGLSVRLALAWTGLDDHGPQVGAEVMIATGVLWTALILRHQGLAWRATSPVLSLTVRAWGWIMMVEEMLLLMYVLTEEPEMLHFTQAVLVASSVTMTVTAVKYRVHMELRAHKVQTPRSRPRTLPYWLGLPTATAVLLTSMTERRLIEDTTWALLGLFLAALLVRQVVATHDYEELTSRLEHQKAHFKSLVQNSTDMIIMADRDTHTAVYVSPAASIILGRDAATLVGKPLHELTGTGADDMRNALAALTDEDSSVHCHGHVAGRMTETVFSLSDDNVLATVRDVTERDQLRGELHQLAYVDQLTGLANRHGFMATLSEWLSNPHYDVSLLFVDLDRFKQVNDTGGHDLGDLVLKDVADRLRKLSGHNVTWGRLGGDEFVALVVKPTPDATPEVLAATETASGQPTEQFLGPESKPGPLSATIVEMLAAPFDLGDRQYQLGGSVGVAHAESGMPATELVRQADIAMYAAKRQKTAIAVYDPSMSAQLHPEASHDVMVARALRDRRFVLYGQPIVSLLSNKLVNVEGLLRWVDTSGKHRPPMDILEFADRTGQMSVITEWVLDRSLSLLQSSSTSAGCAINLTSQDLNSPTLVPRLMDKLQQYGVEPHRLTIEVTEHEAVGQHNRAVATLSALKTAGVRILIDDFGAGYSSLDYLIHLPISGLKLDRSFVSALPRRPAARSIVQSLLTIAHQQDFVLIAEGVETQDEHDWVTSLGCSLGQGYFYGKPKDIDGMPADATVDWWLPSTVTDPTATPPLPPPPAPGRPATGNSPTGSTAPAK